MLFASCKKDYTCEVAGATVTYNDLDKAEADAAQTSCENVSGTWSVK